MARIGVAGLLHETNTFAHSRATLNDFLIADAWPPLLRGDDLISGVRGQNIPSAGFIAATTTQHQIVPLLWASANPSGVVTNEAYETLWRWFEQALRDAGQLDALFLDLHGAMVTEHCDDGEGEWLQRVRAIVGAELPIIVTLDFHANISARMITLSDQLLVYRSYPHIDMATTGARAAHVLPRLLTGKRWHKHWIKLPFQIPLPWQSTLLEPMASIIAQCQQPHDDIAEFAAGFPLADVADSGPTVLVYSDADHSQRHQQLAEFIQARRHLFVGKLQTINEALWLIRRHTSTVPLILAETQDNPGGGGDGDGVALVHALHAGGISDGVVALICDPVFAYAAHNIGVGNTFSALLGAKHNIASGPPLNGPFTVRALSNGKFVGTGPFYGGCHMDLGPMARVDYHGLQLLVSSRNQQAADQSMLRALNIEPAQQRLLVLKSSVHFRADFSAISDAIYLVETPGSNVADLRKLTYRHLPANMQLL